MRVRVFEVLIFYCCFFNTVLGLKYTYSVLKSKNVSPSFSATSLIKTTKMKSNLMCLAECDKLIDCLSVTYNQQQSDCTLLNNTIEIPATETVPDGTANVNYKQLSTFSESCVRTECDHRKLLGCFSDACYCDPNKVENTWCSQLKTCAAATAASRSINEACISNCECNSTQLLICSGGVCACSTTMTPGTLNSVCNYDCECTTSQNLFCRSGVCNCLNSSFEWKGTKCDWILITTYMTADAQTSWGGWGIEQQCPNRGSAIGFQLRVEGDQGGGGDDTALNGIQLVCNDSTLITSSVGDFGGWNAWNNCSVGTYLVAFQFRSQANQGGVDDTAGNDLYMKCSDATTLTNTGGMGWGSWGAWFTCSIGRICGIKTLVEYGGGDDTSLNSVQFTCCFP